MTILNIYAPNTKAPKLENETLLLLKFYTDPNTVIVGGSNMLISQIH